MVLSCLACANGKMGVDTEMAETGRRNFVWGNRIRNSIWARVSLERPSYPVNVLPHNSSAPLLPTLVTAYSKESPGHHN